MALPARIYLGCSRDPTQTTDSGPRVTTSLYFPSCIPSPGTRRTCSLGPSLGARGLGVSRI